MRTPEQIADAYLDGMERGEHSNFRARMTDAIRTAQQEAAKAQALWHAAANRAGLWERKAGKIIEQAGAWKHRALAAESDLELAREQARYRESELVRSGHQQLLEAQANALDTIQRIAAQLPTEPIIDAEKVEQLKEQLRLAVQHGVEHEARTREAEDKAETLARRMDHNVRSFRALEARKVELEAELAENRRAFDATGGHRRKLAELLDQQRKAHERSNDLLKSMEKAANLRDRQVEALSLLWATKTDDERALFGTVFTRQLYRVFADHGIDVEHDMPAYPANIGALITPAEMPVTDRIIREYNHLREHAELVLQADMRNRGRFLGDGLRSALAGLRDAVNNGAPEPTPDIADCA